MDVLKVEALEDIQQLGGRAAKYLPHAGGQIGLKLSNRNVDALHQGLDSSDDLVNVLADGKHFDEFRIFIQMVNEMVPAVDHRRELISEILFVAELSKCFEQNSRRLA